MRRKINVEGGGMSGRGVLDNSNQTSSFSKKIVALILTENYSGLTDIKTRSLDFVVPAATDY